MDRTTSNDAIHDDKLSVPVNKSHHNLATFRGHVTAFIDLNTMAIQKGIGNSFQIYLACLSKNNRECVDAFSSRSQDSSDHKWPEIGLWGKED